MKLRDIYTRSGDFNGLVSLYQQYHDEKPQQIPIEIRGWFDAQMAAPLAALLDLLQQEGHSITFGSIAPGAELILQKNGFLAHYGYPRLEDYHGTTIPYCKLFPQDGRFFQDHIERYFLSRPELPSMSAALRGKILESIFEIFVNAQEHSQTPSIYVCGQFFPKRHELIVNLTDTGIGIRGCYHQRFGRSISSLAAIEWAKKERHTTKRGVPGGLGLSLLEKFVRLNNGRLQIVSHRGWYQLFQGKEETAMLDFPFPGTTVTILFRTDDISSYCLQSENV